MNRFLLDTHVFLWWCANDSQLSANARSLIAASDAVVYVSVVTAWEIVLKHSIGKMRWPFSREAEENQRVEEIVESCGFTKLPLQFQHAEQILNLPRHHGDPFDHMLIAQAQVEGLTLVSNDRAFRAYDVPVLWT